MIYGSVCSGIEAATVAWHPLGWRPAFFSEIEAFPRAVLAHHYPDVPLHGDFTTIKACDYEPIDLLVGGTPCQDFSVAGLRAGMDGDRGNLTLQFLTLAKRLRPKWLVWENVPGVLSSGGGRDFGSFLGGLGELGYGWAYRTLDAQYFGVPQRRRRVFVVGYLGDWRRSAAVLLERHSLQGNPPPRRKAGKAVAALTSTGVGTCGADDNQAQGGHLIPQAFGGNNTKGPIDVATAVNACHTASGRQDFETETFVCAPPLTSNPYGEHENREGLLVAHSLRSEGFDASEDGTGRGIPLVPVAYAENQRNEVRELAIAGAIPAIRRGDAKNETLLMVPVSVHGTQDPDIAVNMAHTLGRNSGQENALCIPLQEVGKRTGASTDDIRAGIGIGSDQDPMFTLQAGAQHGVAIAFSCKDYGADAGDISPTLRSMGHNQSHANAGGQVAVALALRGREGGTSIEIGGEQSNALRASQGGGDKAHVFTGAAVRRLTPRECERLQGFPDDWTAVPYRGKPAADGPRYKALGNSMAVPVMRWIGERIQMVEKLALAREAAE